MRLLGYLPMMVLFSCTLHRNTRMIVQANTYYENSDYRFSYSMPSDYHGVDTSNIYHKKGGRVIVAEFETTDPDFHHTIYLQRNNTEELPGQNVDLLLPNDSIIESVRFWITDSIPQLAVRFSSGTNQFELRAVGNQGESASLLGEYTPIIGSIRVGANYVDTTLLTDAYTLAEPHTYTEDSSINYLQPLLVLERAAHNYATYVDRFSYIQAIATYESRISNGEPRYLDEFYATGHFSRPKKASIDCSSSLGISMEAIYEQIGDNRIVLINENHLDSRGRLLLQLLLPGLKEKGFSAIGFEGLWEPGDSLQARGFPVSTSGFYTKDPRFSNLLRASIKQGFRVFGYDHFETDREVNQALNIKRFMEETKSQKVVVLAGFGHIHEGGTQRRMMASILDSLVGVDPLTIDQVELVAACPNSPLSIGTVPSDTGKVIRVDAYVTNHLNDEDLYDLLPVNYSLREVSTKAYPVVVEVYEASEATNTKAVPVKVIRVERASDDLKFMMWSGNYVVKVKNRYGEELTKDELQISQ